MTNFTARTATIRVAGEIDFRRACSVRRLLSYTYEKARSLLARQERTGIFNVPVRHQAHIFPAARDGRHSPSPQGEIFYLRLSTHVAANPPSSSTLMAKYRMSSMA